MKAPKFSSYDEAVNRKKKKPQNLLSKEEWQALEEERKQNELPKEAIPLTQVATSYDLYSEENVTELME